MAVGENRQAIEASPVSSRLGSCIVGGCLLATAGRALAILSAFSVSFLQVTHENDHEDKEGGDGHEQQIELDKFRHRRPPGVMLDWAAIPAAYWASPSWGCHGIENPREAIEFALGRGPRDVAAPGHCVIELDDSGQLGIVLADFYR